MARLTNGLIAGLNVVCVVLALTAIGFATAYYAGGEKTPCQKFLRAPLMGFGFGLLVMAAMAISGSWYRNSFLLWLYLFVLFFVIVGVTGLTVFSILVLNKEVGHALSGKGFTKHRVADYSTWLQRRVVVDENWEIFRSCFLGNTKMCFKDIPDGKGEDYYKDNLPLLPSGCCKPPNDCEFGFKNATFWNVPVTGPETSTHNKDCEKWSNDQNELCFECYTCRLAFNENVRNKWGVATTINVFILAFVIGVYVVGCCALRNNREEVRKRGIHPRE